MNTSAEQALQVFRQCRGVLRTGEALRLGIHPRTLYSLRDEGMLEEVSRGVFRLTELPALVHPDLVVVAMRVPRGVVCLISALAYHECTSEGPHAIHIALPREAKAPRLAHPPVRIFRFSGLPLTEGIELARLDGIEVPIYNLPKTVVDTFRLRNKLGIDVAVDALRISLQRHRITPADLLPYARAGRVENVMRPYLEALL